MQPKNISSAARSDNTRRIMSMRVLAALVIFLSGRSERHQSAITAPMRTASGGKASRI